MASGQDFAIAINNSVDHLIEIWYLISRIWNLPVQQDQYKQLSQYLLALPEALTQASNFTESLARSHEQARALRAHWNNANITDRVMTTLDLAIGLAQSRVPDFISGIFSYFYQGHFEEDFRSLWGSSSLESKVAMMFFLVWLIFYASLHSVRWLRQGR